MEFSVEFTGTRVWAGMHSRKRSNNCEGNEVM